MSPRESVTINDILERRAKAGKLVAGTAASSDSDMFKAPSVGKPKAKRWDHHLTAESLSRQPCMLKLAARHLKKPGLISLGGGLPCPEYFPFDSLSMKVPVAPNFSEASTKTTGKTVTIGKHDVAENPDAVYDLAIGLNYGQATGSAQMLRWVTEHTEMVCNPPYADWRSCLTVGSTGALEQALRMFCDRQRGDSVLMDEFAFSTALETAEPLGIKVVGVAIDQEGLLPASMDDILSHWDPKEHNGVRKPHVLYTVPSGQNPTGATMGTQRRRDIYAVCQKHDVFIIEDEPYYFLQMDPYVPAGTGSSQQAISPSYSSSSSAPESVDEFLDSLIPSLLSMDVDGRVLRMDSFSKVVIPGSRMGWVTGSAQIIERYTRHAEVASQGPAGLSQVVLYKLLDEHWGHEGYFQWLMNLRAEYTKRRNILLGACEEFVPREVVSWDPPAAGMFQWFRVNYSLHPDAGRRSILEIEEEIFDLCIEKGALVARGSWFAADHGKPLEDLFFRATFAAAAPGPMREAIRRFGEAVKTSFRI
ncbi:hypothetical protein M406DRAFT_46703 [Cryphonectria parasitica EP155]|uniref:aromatic-amino-acid transaminase n=1 Tax=Cryphonectria parasitica (strain ATCC 38755 / EP155) TaxID=660469 RepID=A0A9P4XW39_CRYP1|nr:uncharacterized protein M406DRAFT_46703 [Cryphonectria parasitica EP155]KAF3762367.1 hypothetical protein M406DRAFT_46703 [Cryphonectria parasitica EP155]